MFVPFPHPQDPKRQLLVAADNIAGVDFSKDDDQDSTVYFIHEVAGISSMSLRPEMARDLRSTLSLD